jgi:hypothetical protein
LQPKRFNIIVALYAKRAFQKEEIKIWLTNEKSELIRQVSNFPGVRETVTIKVSSLDYDRANLIVTNYKKTLENKFPFEP